MNNVLELEMLLMHRYVQLVQILLQKSNKFWS